MRRMHCSNWSLATRLFLGAVFAIQAAFAQSVSIGKQSDGTYHVDVDAPASAPYALQASANLHLWADVHEPAPGTYTYRFDGTNLTQRYFRLAAAAEPAPEIHVVLLGDSITDDCCGWGQGIERYFKPNALVINYAVANSSTKSFLRSEELDKMLVLKPDYVLIQFGVVDQAWGPVQAPDYYTSPEEFAANLRTIVKMVRDFNGIPILITIHSARQWDNNGHIIPSWKERNDVIKGVAAELQTQLIDLNQLTLELFNRMGPAGTAFMHWSEGSADDIMHMSPLGALYVSQLVVNALPDAFGPYLTGIFDPPPKP